MHQYFWPAVWAALNLILISFAYHLGKIRGAAPVQDALDATEKLRQHEKRVFAHYVNNFDWMKTGIEELKAKFSKIELLNALEKDIEAQALYMPAPDPIFVPPPVLKPMNFDTFEEVARRRLGPDYDFQKLYALASREVGGIWPGWMLHQSDIESCRKLEEVNLLDTEARIYRLLRLCESSFATRALPVITDAMRELKSFELDRQDLDRQLQFEEGLDRILKTTYSMRHEEWERVHELAKTMTFTRDLLHDIRAGRESRAAEENTEVKA